MVSVNKRNNYSKKNLTVALMQTRKIMYPSFHDIWTTLENYSTEECNLSGCSYRSIMFKRRRKLIWYSLILLNQLIHTSSIMGSSSSPLAILMWAVQAGERRWNRKGAAVDIWDPTWKPSQKKKCIQPTHTLTNQHWDSSNKEKHLISSYCINMDTTNVTQHMTRYCNTRSH